MSCETDVPSLVGGGDLDVHDVGGVVVVEAIGGGEPMVLKKLPCAIRTGHRDV